MPSNDYDDLVIPGYGTVVDDLSFVAETITVDDAEQFRRHSARLAACGRLATKLNPLTGRYTMYRQRCGYWRNGECKRCLDHRTWMLQKDLERAAGGHELRMIEVRDGSGDSVANVIRRAGLDKADYLKLVIDGAEVLIVRDDHAAAVERAVGHNAVRLDPRLDNLARLTMTPEGKNRSGTLCKSSPPPTPSTPVVVEEDEPMVEPIVVTVEVEELILEEQVDPMTIKAADDEAAAATADLDPHDGAELFIAIAVRQVAFKAALGRRNVTPIMTLRTKVQVDVTKLKWKVTPVQTVATAVIVTAKDAPIDDRSNRPFSIRLT